MLVASCSFANPYNDGVTFYKHLASPQLHMPMYTTFGLFSGKKWVKRFGAPSSIHGVNFALSFKKFFKNLAYHEIFSHKLTTSMV
jgi:hypothetical protein